MRLVQVPIPAGKREAVLRALDEEDIDYVVADETSGREYTAVVSFPLPDEAVEPILEDLRDAGIERDSYTVVIDAETVVSRKFEQLKERYEEEVSENRIAREELIASVDDLSPSTTLYTILTAVAAIIATAGLLLDSAAIVVGSMVIAPLMGPAMAASVGTVVGDTRLFGRGLRLQIIGFVVAIVSATVFAWVIRTVPLIPPGLEVTTIGQVQERTRPDFLSLLVALGAGVAGSLSLITGVSSALVGVMIAVALLPPAATVGIGIAWGLPTLALDAGILALVNALSINLAALLVLSRVGYRPAGWLRLDQARQTTTKRMAVLGVIIVALSLFLVGVTASSLQTSATESAIASEVQDQLDSPAYENATVVEVRVEFHEAVLSPRSPRRVIVTIGRPPGREYPGLARLLRNRLSEYGSPVVEVRYIDIDRAGQSKGSSGS